MGAVTAGAPEAAFGCGKPCCCCRTVWLELATVLRPVPVEMVFLEEQPWMSGGICSMSMICFLSTWLPEESGLPVLNHLSWFPRTLALREAAWVWTSSLYMRPARGRTALRPHSAVLFASQALSVCDSFFPLFWLCLFC